MALEHLHGLRLPMKPRRVGPLSPPPRSIHLSHLPPPRFSKQVSLWCLSFFCLLYLRAFFLAESRFLPHPHPSPSLSSPLSLTHSFTLGPNYEIASNKYMYFPPARGAEKKSLHSLFFFFFFLVKVGWILDSRRFYSARSLCWWE